MINRIEAFTLSGFHPVLFTLKFGVLGAVLLKSPSPEGARKGPGKVPERSRKNPGKIPERSRTGPGKISE
eukprot:12398131-Karenia_brevis.AAC.1